MNSNQFSDWKYNKADNQKLILFVLPVGTLNMTKYFTDCGYEECVEYHLLSTIDRAPRFALL